MYHKQPTDIPRPPGRKAAVGHRTSGRSAPQNAQLKAKLNAQVEFRRTIAENPAMYYEQYVLGEISLDEFKVKQQKLRQAAEDQKAIELEIEECEQAYRWFSRLCKVRDKELPLSTIMSEINNIVVDIGRKVVVQWIIK